MAADRQAGPTAGALAHHVRRLYAAIPARHARRSFDGERVSAADLDALSAFAEALRPWPGARVTLVREAPQALFAGIVGSYGGISGASSALVFIGDDGAGPAAVGYTGEAVVLEATARGLDTCWVAGVFSKQVTAAHVTLGPGERILAISPVGHAREHATVKERLLFGAARAKHRRPLDEIAPGHAEWPAWARAAVEAARVAPSAMNRQPWRFRMEDGALVVGFAGADVTKARTSKLLDVGIAMLHAELGARAEGASGRWEVLAGTDVARYVPDAESAAG